MWATSLARSGFKGKKALIVYEGSDAFIEKAKSEGFLIARGTLEKGDTVYFKRYHDIWLNAANFGFNKCRYVIHTDVRDVVFQTNPSDAFHEHEYYPVRAATEAIAHKDDWWNAECMKQSFGPDAYEITKDRIVYCSGVIAGTWDYLGPLFLQIYMISKASPVSNCDQSAYNILAHSEPYKRFVGVPDLSKGWCLNCAIALHPEKSKGMVESGSVSQHDGVVFNDAGKPFAILHQYDRSEVLKEKVERRYKEPA